MPQQRTVRRALTALLVIALAAVGIYTVVGFLQRSETLVSERCTATVGALSAELATDQAHNAALISALAVRRGLPPRAATIALATAMQESKLRNIDYGDRAGPDSRGLFQQRPSQGWGTEAQVMDPYYATNAFYDVLVTVEGYEALQITEAAQRVQRSAFPEAYAQHEDMGRAFASGLTGQAPAVVTCTLRSPEASGDTAAVIQELEAAYGPITATPQEDGSVRVETPYAWSVAQWAVASAKDLGITGVEVGGQAWDRGTRTGWQAASGTAENVVPDGTVEIRLAVVEDS
ncbi:hypothetical protein V1639_05670 [Pseudarthrobacter sp. J75]|uniref:hypothetical protein n=1 Tax=unclassified Pseudarthrobacter TaxID=2647000 RepID=UPI002E814165|nr:MULTISPECIES: hypothetical protein [unclassified Pseudarthrobacter]MEE2521286.1 hypothetical protein [Pseudarthrobacter sp. J47]MEE2528518.1 hypothetical protein [Pseudarthrobacter sp. J75]